MQEKKDKGKEGFIASAHLPVLQFLIHLNHKNSGV